MFNLSSAWWTDIAASMQREPSGGPALGNHFVNQAVGLRLGGRHEVVALGVTLDFFQGLPGVFSQQLVQVTTQAKDFTCVDFNVRRLALRTAQGLMDHDARVGQGKTFAFGTR